MIERPLGSYPIDPKTKEGPLAWLKVEIGGGLAWLQGSGFLYVGDDDDRETLMFEIGGRVVRPRCFAFLEETVS